MAPECPDCFFGGAQSIDLYYYNGRVVQIGQKTSFFLLKGTWAKIDRKRGKLHSLNRFWFLMKFFFFCLTYSMWLQLITKMPHSFQLRFSVGIYVTLLSAASPKSDYNWIFYHFSSNIIKMPLWIKHFRVLNQFHETVNHSTQCRFCQKLHFKP